MQNIFKLNKDQILKLSDIFSDVGLVLLATVILPSVFDRVDETRVILGWTATVICWLISLLLRK